MVTKYKGHGWTLKYKTTLEKAVKVCLMRAVCGSWNKCLNMRVEAPNHAVWLQQSLNL